MLVLSRRGLDGAPPGGLWFEAESAGWEMFPQQTRLAAAATLLRRTVFLPPFSVRPYFVTCAHEGWRRVRVGQLAAWSGIPVNVLKRRLAVSTLTPPGIAAWNLALHALWLLDVAELPARVAASSMRLGRTGAIGAILGARGVRYAGGKVAPGAFAAALERYVAVLRSAFGT